MVKELNKLTREFRGKNGYFAILLFVFLGILAAAFSALNFLFGLLIIIIVPLIILPLSFSFQRATIIMRDQNQTLSFKMIWDGFKMYFSPRFNSTYNFFRTLLWGLLIYVVLTIVTDIVINLSFYYTNYNNWHDIITELATLIKNMDTAAIENFMVDHQREISIYLLFSEYPVMVILSFYALRNFMFHSTTMFLRFSSLNYTGQYFRALFLMFLKKNRKEYTKAFYYLNWPMFVLFAGGMALGSYLTSLYKLEASLMFTGGLMMGLLLMFAIYGVFYIASKEALHHYFSEQFRLADIDLRNQIIAMSNQLYGRNNIPNEVVDSQEEIKNDSDESQ